MRAICTHFLSPLICFLVFSSLAFGQTIEPEFIIASGSRGGNYFEAGRFITRIFNEENLSKFLSIESNGSIDNIELLKNNDADFALVQRNILINSLYNKGTGINNIEVIAPLFEEKLLIYIKESENISIDSLKTIVQNNQLRFGFTSDKGYSYELYKMVFNFLGIDKQNIREKFANYEGLIKDFKKDSIDVLVSFSLPLSKLENEPNSSKVYFNESSIHLLSRRLSNLYRTQLEDKNDELSLGSWVFLVGSSDRINEIPHSNSIFTKLYNENNTSVIGTKISASIIQFKKNKEWNKKYLDGIPMNQTMIRELGIIPSRLPWIIVVSGISIIALFYFWIGKKIISSHSPRYLWHRFKHIVIGVGILIFLYFISVELLLHSERQFYKTVGVKSQLLNLNSRDLHAWVIIKTTADIDDGIKPLSTLGKLMVSLCAYIVYIGALIIALSELIINQISIKRKKGLMDITFENHIIIIGWNDMASDFVEKIISESKIYKGTNSKVVCIIKSPTDVLEKQEKLRQLQSEKRIHFVKGNSRDRQTMKRANLHKAETIILLAENTSQESDERTLLRALAISRYCKLMVENKTKLPQKKLYETFDVGNFVDSSYVIAEINDPQFKKDLIEADVNEVILTATYTKGVIIQSAFNHGISKVMDELLQYNNYNEIYTVDLKLPEHKHLVGKTYDELLGPLRARNILLLAVKIIYHDINNREIIDETKINQLLRKENLNRQIIMNPISSAENNRKTDNDDILMVLCTNRKELKSKIKEVSFRQFEKNA